MAPRLHWLIDEQRRYCRGPQHKAEAERGLLRRRFGEVPGDRKVDRGTEVLAGTVVIDAVTDRQAFGALRAERIGVTPAAVALAWVQGRPGVTSTLIGPRRVDQLEANLAALDLDLTAEHRAALDAISAPQLNFPAALNRDLAPMLQYAGATVNGQPTSIYPPLLHSPTRY